MAFVSGEIIDRFRKQFGTTATPALYRAPGRVNLIGEHTDYNLGYVFPIALEMACYIAIAPASHGKLRVYSRELAKEASLSIADIATAKPAKQWSDYIFGVAQELTKAGFPIGACDMYVASEVPAGSGLSSSAALEIATAVALLGGRALPQSRVGQTRPARGIAIRRACLAASWINMPPSSAMREPR